MASTSSSSAGLVGALRGAATTERLRSDHIMTLELMQETVDENDMLKELNKRLHARLKSLGDDGSSSSTAVSTAADTINNDNDSNNSSAAMVQRILKQEKELTSLRNENKMLKARSMQDERQIRDLQRKLTSYDSMHKELEGYKALELAAAATDNETNMASAVLILETEVEDLKSQIHTLTSSLHTSQSDYSSHMQLCTTTTTTAANANANINIITALQSEILTLQQTLLQNDSKVVAVTEEKETLQGNYNILQSKYQDLRKMSNIMEVNLQEKLHICQLENISLQSELNKLKENGSIEDIHEKNSILMLENKKLSEMLVSLKEELARMAADASNPLLLKAVSTSHRSESERAGAMTEDSNLFFLTIPSTNTPSTAINSNSVSVEDAGIGGSCTFAEFVALKKEIKYLKLQLLDQAGTKQRCTCNVQGQVQRGGGQFQIQGQGQRQGHIFNKTTR
jgi:hypothetical protein